MEKARYKQLAFGRYSNHFNTLSPGMKVLPICLAKNKLGRTRMCANMSFEDLSPNDLVDEDSASIQLNPNSAFIPQMLKRHQRGESFVIWKSYCDSAFRTLPVCFQQQVKQVVRIKEKKIHRPMGEFWIISVSFPVVLLFFLNSVNCLVRNGHRWI